MSRTQFIAKEGFRGLLIGIGVLLIAFLFNFELILFCSLFFIMLWVFAFRNPERHPAERAENGILAPCDGTIINIIYENGLVNFVIQIDWGDVGLVRAPYRTSDIQINILNGLKSTFILPETKELLNTKIYYLSKNFDMMIKPEVFKANLFNCPDVYAGDRIGFCKLGTVEVVFKDTFLNMQEIKVGVGDTVKGGETLLGYANEY